MIAALHRCSQLNLPVIVFCAGLPKLLKSMSEAKTYSERLFEFVEVGSLSNDAARKAIEEPTRLIYSTGYGEVDYTVPQFDKFLERERSRSSADR